MKKALIVAGGRIDIGQLAEEVRRLRGAEGGKATCEENPSLVIAADSGLEALRRAQALCGELAVPDMAVGDFDSVSAPTLAYFTEKERVRFERHRPEKDQSDTELALTLAARSGVTDVLLMGATGTRLDHVLANIHLLKEAMDMGLACTLLDSHNRIRLLAGRTVFRRETSPYAYVSFVPLTVEVTHVFLRGFRYPLTDYQAVLGSECGRMVSNEIQDEEAVADFASGLLLAIESRD